MQQTNNELLSDYDIKILDQNYVSSNSDLFMQELQSLFESYLVDGSSNENSYKEFETLYSLAQQINPAALPYSKMTTLIFKDDELSESIEMLITDLETFIYNKFQNLKTSNLLTKSDATSIAVISKAREHLNLAYTQKQNLYNKQRNEVNKLMQQLENEKSRIEDLKKDLATEQEKIGVLNSQSKEYKDKYNKLTIDFLSMMGVFSTIIFAVFGGLSQIGAIGDNLAETPIPKILMYISLSSITLIFIVFISFNAIAKLTGLKLRSCKCEDESECKHNIFTKHPSLSLSLFFFLDLFLFAIVLRILHTDNWISSLHLFEWDSTSLSKWGPVISFIAFNCIIGGVLLWRTFNKRKS